MASSASAHDCLERDRLLAEIDLAAHQTGHVQQIVEQTREVLDLALDGIPRQADSGIAPGLAPNRLHGDPNWHERIAQLVGEHRQELVLGAALRFGRCPGHLMLGRDLRLVLAELAGGHVRGDLARHDCQEAQVVIGVGVGLPVADEEHTDHAVEADEGDRQVRRAGDGRSDVQQQRVSRPRRLVAQGGQEAAQHRAQRVPHLRRVGLDDEPGGAGRWRLEKRAAVVGHDAAEQPEGTAEPKPGVER